VALATYPGESFYRNPIQVKADQINLAPWRTQPLVLSELLFEGHPNEITGRPNSLFSNVLILPDQVLVDHDKITKNPEETSISLRGRDLRSIVLSRSDMRNADFTGANLTNAKLDNAVLKMARFECASTGRRETHWNEENNRVLFRAATSLGPEWTAQPPWPDDGCTWLQSAWLLSAQMQGASLERARLYGATLDNASLQGASLWQAQLQGASLVGVHLEGALLDGVNLVATRISGTNLQGASISEIGLPFEHNGAKIFGAVLRDVRLQGASLDSANVAGSRFEDVHFFRTQGPLMDYTSADFDRIDFQDKGYGNSFHTWRENILSSLPTESLGARVEERLKLLDPLSLAPKGLITRAALTGAAFSEVAANAAERQKALSKLLLMIVCLVDQPHFIVQGLIANDRARATGPYLDELIAELRNLPLRLKQGGLLSS
jgi:uncharacterized protein YjbI with pentapeptide repeats